MIKSPSLLAVLLLLVMFILAVTSMTDDSMTMDEVAHLPAGYSYLTQQDMRLNPEHPPLVKDLAALPLLLINGIKFPSDIKDWQEDVNGQWGFGFNFMYKQGNPVEQMIFWGRLPMLALLILLGYFVFRWARELWGSNAALLALTLFAFSPTLLAHGRLVTTDVPAALGVVLGLYYFVKALKEPNTKHLVISGLAFGLAQLLKFSAILLVPTFIVLALLRWRANQQNFWLVAKTLFLTFVIGFLLVWPVYLFHTWNYPPERQIRDSAFLLSSFSPRFAAEVVVWLSDKPILRPYGQYLTGLLMATQRVSGGNTTYFLGEVSAAGWKNYFPVVYTIKEPLAFHILMIIALIVGALRFKGPFWHQTFGRFKSWLGQHLPETAMLTFIIIYWIVSLRSPLNIGVRHLLPALPLTIMLIARQMAALFSLQSLFSTIERSMVLKSRYATMRRIIGPGLIAILLIWQVISALMVYPSFLAYFNELVGGPDNGYIYVVDSNLDWGQDLKRLKKWVDQNNIDKIYVDYFGGSDAKYILGEKFVSWWGQRNPADLPPNSYLAVSATFLQGGRGLPAPGFDQPTGYYRWLDQHQSITKIGYSIFVYHIK